jgi:predicted LPLAT superfamily acyltransferase
MDNAHSTSASWTRRPERGSLFLVRFMVWYSLAVGRPLSRLLMHAIAVYFYLSSPAARRHSREYLGRVLGREPTLGERFGHLHAFATMIHDRVFFIAGRIDAFDVQVHGAEALPKSGALLMGAHLGSFEALRAAGRGIGQRRVAMAMYEENARRLNGVLAAIDPAALDNIVPLGHVDSMLRLRDRLDAGDLVGVLADRTLGNEPVIRVPFLGAAASFPTGPMRMAAALRQPVFLMVGLYRGGNRYEVRFEPLADFSQPPTGDRYGTGTGQVPVPGTGQVPVPGTGQVPVSRVPVSREVLVQEAIARYAARVEHYARSAPDNWFNFFDFWGPR